MRFSGVFFAIFFLFFFKNLSSQEQLGLRLERFSGIHSASINPANLSSMAVKWDISLGGIGQFVETNYLFVKNTNVSEILKTSKDSTHFYITNLAPDAVVPTAEQIIVDFPQRKRRYFGVNRTLALLPSVAFHAGEYNTFGFSLNFRFDAMTHSIPSSLGYPSYDARPRFEEFKISRMSVAAMGFLDAGFHFSRKIETGNGVLSVGSTLHILQGLEGGYARSEGSFFLTKWPKDSVVFRNTEFEGGLTNSNFGLLSGQKPRFSPNGFGMGVDLGATYSPDAEDLDDGDYPWKIGFSILDIGRVGFRKNTERHQFYNDSSFVIDPNEYEFFDDPHLPIRQTSASVLGDSAASFSGEKFSIQLPFAFAAQGDFRVFEHFYVHSMIVQRVDFGKAALQRPNISAVVPRFEKRWYSVSLPFVVSEWQHFRVGLAARLGFLVIGTDNLNSFVYQKKLTGTDFYLALKINSFRFWGEDSRQKMRGWRGSKISCPKF